VDK
jgi:hypothetical protein